MHNIKRWTETHKANSLTRPDKQLWNVKANYTNSIDKQERKQTTQTWQNLKTCSKHLSEGSSRSPSEHLWASHKFLPLFFTNILSSQHCTCLFQPSIIHLTISHQNVPHFTRTPPPWHLSIPQALYHNIHSSIKYLHKTHTERERWSLYFVIRDTTYYVCPFFNKKRGIYYII